MVIPKDPKKRNLLIIILSSAFTQHEAERTLLWMDQPNISTKDLKRAIARGLHKRNNREQEPVMVATIPVINKIDSLVRRLDYKLSVVEEELKETKKK